MQATRLLWKQKFIIYRSTIVFKILCYLLFRFGNVKPALTIENKRMRTSSALRSSCCRGPHARNLTGLRGTSSYTRDIACVAYLSPCFQALLHDVRGWESSLQIYARVFFPAQNILEVPRKDEKSQNFPQPVVSGNSYNKTGTNYVILSAVGQSPVEDWNSNEIVIPAKLSQCFSLRIAEILSAVLVVFYIDVSFAYYLTFSKIRSQCLLNMKIDKRPLRSYTQRLNVARSSLFQY